MVARDSAEAGSGARLCSELPAVDVGNGRKVEVWDFVVLCRKASAAILEVYRQPEAEWELEHKGGNEPLTKADLKSNQILIEGLRTLCPDCLLVSEESAHASHDERCSAEFVWLVDPLDGTKEFLKRSGEFAVNLGLCHRGIPVFGIVASPVEDTVYIGGVVLGGAWKLQGDNQELIGMQCNTFRWSDPGLRVTASSSHSSPDTKAFISRLQRPRLIKAG